MDSVRSSMVSIVLKTVFALLIVYLLVQYLFVSYYNESRTFDKLITTRQENFPSSQFYNAIQSNEAKDNYNHFPMCPQMPPDLNGKMDLLVPAQETFEEVARQLSWLGILEGGQRIPIDCQAQYTIAIIVPYRNRLANLCSFLLNMHPFLSKQQLNYTIFVIEQFDNSTIKISDDGQFNRAMLMNVGFIEALKLQNFDCFFFHDVDLIPEDYRNVYSCPDQPRHMAVAVEKYGYRLPYENYFGGVLAISQTHFKLINGFSNMFWGWGGEDDDLAYRVLANHLQIIRYPPDVARYHSLKHEPQKPNPDRYTLLNNGEERFKTDGLNSLRYRVLVLKQLPLFTHLLVDLDRGNGP